MNKNRNKAAFTIGEAIVLVCIVSILAVFLVESLARSREEPRKAYCRENLSEIGKAAYVYSQNYNDYFPFAWQHADAAPPSGNGAANAEMAMTSIGVLYPQYLTTARYFKCPATKDQPALTHFPAGRPQGGGGGFGCSCSKPPPLPQSGGVVSGSSYGYDCRISPKAVSNHAIMADMDGSWQVNHDTSTQNHDGGQNVLYADWRVYWQQVNFCSNDPADNIYAEDAWNADTDSYVVRMDMGLGKSFDGYPELHYGAPKE